MITMHSITVILYFIFVQFWNLDCRRRECKWYGKLVCCRNLRYNEVLDTCEDCPIGYYFWNCSRKCQPPFYGEGCQKECECGIQDCHFSNGCPGFKISSHVTTHAVTTNAESETISYATTRIITKTPTPQTTPTKQPNDSLSHNTNFNLILGSVGLGLFLLLFGMFIGVYIYKSLQRNVGRISVNEGVSKEDSNYTPIRQQSESHQGISQVGNVPENPEYLTPVSERIDQYEEVCLYDLPDESGNLEEYQVEQCYSDTINDVTDLYLNPQSVPQHVYVEVI